MSYLRSCSFSGLLIAALAFSPTSLLSGEGQTHGIRYLNPVPDSRFVSPHTTIIIRADGPVEAASVASSLVRIHGTESGYHTGEIRLSDDGETLVFDPSLSFAPGERVSVELRSGLRKANGTNVKPFMFEFTVSSRWEYKKDRLTPILSAMEDYSERGISRTEFPLRQSTCDTLPPDYPFIAFGIIDNPEPGNIFIAPFPTPTGIPGHLMILDNRGEPMFYRRMQQVCLDFKRQPDGTLTYFGAAGGSGKFHQIDSSYALIDSFSTGNGYTTDLHELVLLENGHALLMSYDPQIVRMDTVVKGGDSAATVIGLIIQELDVQKNVVFQWRSWDHFQITDGIVSGLVSLDSSLIDYAHGNAIERDSDGNLLISSRHMNEVTKIDRATGEIIWRLGLNALNNEFTFVNDTRGWSHQHDIRRLSNGNITLYDNGNFLSPEYSRGVEYQLDEANKTATLVWEHRNDPDVYGPFMGNVQRLESGSSMIGWGGWSETNFTEVNAAGEPTFQGGFYPGMYNYRSFRFPWKTNLFRVSADTLDFGVVAAGDTSHQALVVTNNSADSLVVNCVSNSDSSFSWIGTIPVTIPPWGSIGLTVVFEPGGGGDFLDHLYVRSVNDTQLVAQSVVVKGTTTVTGADPGQGLAISFRLSQNYPNPFNATTTFSITIHQSSIVNLTIHDLLGREIATIVNERLGPGSYTRQWDATGFASGVYFYRLKAGGSVQAGRLVLLR